MSLDVGIVLANAAVVAGTSSPADLLRVAEAVDDASGFGHLWVGDSLLAAPRLEAITLLAACAARTRRVRLGVGCLVSLGLRDPLLFALQWASLDQLSNGRMTLVACTGPAGGGLVEHELAAYGMTFNEKVQRMEEHIALLRLARSPGPITLDSEHYDLSEITLLPRFVQEAPPIWMVANPSLAAPPETVERLLGRVARLGDGWMTFGIEPNALRARIALLAELRAAAGRASAEPFPICAYIDVNLNPDEHAAFDDAVITCRQEGRHNATAEQLRETAAIGSAEQCCEFIMRLVDVGVTSVALRPVTQHPLQQVELIAEHLLPRLAGY